MKAFDDFLDMRIDLFGKKIRVVDIFFFSVLLGLGISMRMALFDYISGDYRYFLSVWLEECRQAGGMAYLGIEPGITEASTINYGCMYQYIIVLVFYLSRFMDELHLLKIVSVIFDVVCAVTVMRLTYMVTAENEKKALMAFGIVMFLPTSVLNSGAWAQCDSIYTAFVLLGLLHLMKGDDMRLFIYLALAFSFKQQAVFLVPFLIIMWLKGKVKARYVLVSPVVLFLTLIPALIAGRRLGELLSIYGKQVVTYTDLTMNYPSIYTVISSKLDEDYRKLIISAGTIATVAVLGVIAYYVRDKKFEITREYMITLAIFTIEVCLFVLPVMHERYGYLPELMAVAYGVTRYRRMVICAGLQVISVITYSRFLFGSTVKDLWPLTLFMFAAIMALGYDLNKQMNSREGKYAGIQG